MIPVLYNEEEMEFITQGIGALSDAISCKVVEELNGSYELTMQYPVTGLHFSDIILNRLILADHAPSRQSEPFQIYKISKPINGIVTIYAEHISYRLSYVPVSPFTANNCVEALNGLKEHADEPCQFTLYTDKSTIAEYKQIVPHSFRELLGGVDGSILDTYRGEYEFNRFNIRFTQHRGVYKKSASIRYGKNLTDLKQEESIENTVTGIYPYWQGTKTITSTSSDGETVSKTEDVVVTLPEKIIYSENKDKYSYHRTIPKDFAYRFQDKPTEAQLRAATQSYVKEIGVPEVNLTVSFLSLASMEENKHFADETVYLGDTVPVEFIKLGIMTDAEIIKATYDTLMDRYDTLELGTTSSSLSKTIVAMQKKYESAVQKSQLDQIINEQQLKISGGLGGSVVTTYSNNEPSETVYGDTNDVKTMLNCMRVNKSGIAFSNNGYSGPYNSAWTIDGKFNADFIQAGHINGNLITGNTIKAGALDKSITDDIANSKEKLINLQDQVDGLIETWSGADKPTLLNYPAVDWNEKEKKNHIGDLYYDANNKCYRFMQNDDGTFTWKLLADTDVTKAIADATKALDATNNSIAGVTTEWYASESPTELYGGTWSEEKPEWNENNYIWSRSKAVTQAGVISYSQPSCVQGNTGAKGERGLQGIQGKQGEQGIPGKDGSNGTNGKTSYFHIKYSSVANPTSSSQMTETPSTYIGTYVDYTEADSSEPSKYTWSRFQGIQGDKGIPGTDGANGKTSYLHIAYANSADGKTGFDVSNSVNKLYIGQYTDFNPTDSTDYTKYSWTKIKGETGPQGIPGVKGTDGKTYYTWIKYADSPTSGMSDNPSGKKYMGVAYNKTSSTESTTYSDYSWSLIKGDKGDTGDKGATGNGIKSIAYTYARTTSQTAPSADSITATTMPTIDATNKYLWQKEVITYTNGQSQTTVLLLAVYGNTGAKGERGLQGIQGKQGEQGIPGKDGSNGTNGKTSYFHIKYSSVANPTSSSQMTETPSTYIGTYVDYTEADSSEPSKYTWSRFQGIQGDKGIPGTDGANGKTSYLHIAYANSADGKTGFDVSNSVNKLYIGQYTDFNPTDSTDYTKYSWTKIKGETGPQGIPGVKGTDGKTYYTWIKYADSPTSGMSDNPSGKKYMGVAYNKTSSTESTTYSDYSWSLIKGDKGDTGDKGATGNGIKSIAYTYARTTSQTAPSADSITATTMPTIDATNKYLWQKEVITYTNGQSQTTVLLLAVYGNTGSKGDKGDPGIKGDTGAPGSPGKDGTSVTITSQAITYQASSSGTTIPTGTWVANPPSVAKGQYLWTRTVVNYSDGKKTTAYSVGYQGTNGQNGQNGSPGRGVKSTEVTYQIWANGASTPSGTWQTSVPDTTADKPYLWTRTVITYTDNTKSTSYSVGSTLKGVNVGGRNLILRSGMQIAENKSTDKSYSLSVDTSFFRNKKIVISLDIEADSAYGSNGRVGTELSVTYADGTTEYYGCWLALDSNGNAPISIHKRISRSYHILDKEISVIGERCIYIQRLTKGKVTASKPKLELGNIATDWTPAPEDVDADINSVNNAASVAQDTANKAMNNAIQAQGTSTDAFNKANQAQSSANDASNKAETAITSSKEAQSLATQAQSLANKANSDAYNAMEAIKAQNQVFYADSTGAHIRKAGTNNETRVVADGVEIIADNTKVAEFTKTQGRVSNLVADKFLYVGAHRLEKFTQDGEVGTGFFWTGGAL